MEEIVQEALSKGVEMHVAGDFEFASQLYSSVIKLQPNHAEIELNWLIVWATKGFRNLFASGWGENGYCVVQLAILKNNSDQSVSLRMQFCSARVPWLMCLPHENKLAYL